MSDKKETPEYIEERDGFMYVTLASPATIEGTKLDVMKMREPTVGDMRRMQKIKDEAEREIVGMSDLCEISPKDVEGLSLRNYGRLQEAFALFTS